MGFFDSSTTSTSTNDAYGRAKGPMDQALDFMGSQPYAQAYGGNYNAAINPMLQNNLNQMGTTGNSLYNQAFQPGMDMMGRGMGGYESQLQALQNRGPNQFNFDQGTYNQMMDNSMPGLRSAVDAQGKMSSMALQSNLGQLTSAAGGAGSLGGNPLSKLGQGGAALQAQTALNNQNFAAGLYNNANQQATNAGMQAGGANMNALNRNDSQVLGGYGNMANMGKGLAGMGLKGLGMGLQAGQIQQGLDQFGVDSARQQFMDTQSIPMQDAMSRAKLSGDLGNLFGTKTTTTTQNPSMMSNLGQVAGLAASVYGGMGGMGGISGMFGGGGAGPQFGMGAGSVGHSNPMDGWWM